MQVRGFKFNKGWIATPIALALAAFLLYKADLGRIAEALSEAPLGVVISGLLLYLAFNLLKALRFHLLLKRELPLARLIPLTLIYSFWSNLLPMRAGDLAYLYMLRSGGRVPVSKGISSLAVGTFFDVALILSSLLGLGIALRGDLEGALPRATLLILPALIVAVALLLSGMVLLGRRMPMHKGGGVIAKAWGKVSEAMGEMGKFRLKDLLLGMLPLSIGLLLVRFGLQCYLAEGMGFRFGWARISFALAFASFCNLFPIQSVAGLGTVEAPWSWALVGLGEGSGDAIASGFALHGLMLSYAIVSGGVGWISWSLTRVARGSGTSS